jgi:hypothetical protein
MFEILSNNQIDLKTAVVRLNHRNRRKGPFTTDPYRSPFSSLGRLTGLSEKWR